MQHESRYIHLFLEPVRKCQHYQPKFGEGNSGDGVSLARFLDLYGADPFYAWIGLDSELMYAAHKAAGGMTSIYRQIGIGCEHLFREILIDTAAYENPAQATWAYSTQTSAGKEKSLSLDGRLAFGEIRNLALEVRLAQWLAAYCKGIGAAQTPSNGVVFEVRQGYKSKDSKRQNADIDNATVAWANGYLPVFAIFSAQIDTDLGLRYRNNRCGILTGSPSNDPAVSLFAFAKEILDYDLADFFRRNSAAFKSEIQATLKALLDPNGTLS
ncbi:MAG: hypothetical protein ACK4Q5_20785 [Saprospiraceae bacterium]